MPPEVQLLPWDSAWLGFPVARLVAGPAIGAPEVTAALAGCRVQGVRLLYVVLPVDSQAIAQVDGAWLADVRLTYQRLVEQPQPPAGFPATERASIRKVTALTPALEQLAWQSGEHSRFRRDVRLPAGAYQELYSTWLSRMLTQGTVWAVVADDEVIGMLALDARAVPARIELVAVAPAARRQGIGQLLVQAALCEAAARHLALLEVVTQGANHAARYLYEREGFRLLDSRHIYHIWL
ncbi:MAG: GNAT family N-acetyltransferase [Bacteroidota bacterium]|nr:GNAT family N-acetyltransferase [Bacteroidota bacterium]